MSQQTLKCRIGARIPYMREKCPIGEDYQRIEGVSDTLQRYYNPDGAEVRKVREAIAGSLRSAGVEVSNLDLSETGYLDNPVPLDHSDEDRGIYYNRYEELA